MTTDRSTAENHHLHIFLCHAHEDQDVVFKLYQRLQADGFQPWMDKEDLIPGQDWQTEIRKAVQESQVFLACVSKNSTTKAGFVNREINFALDVAEEQPEGDIFIVPLRLDKESVVPDRLRRWQWCDYFARDGYARLMGSLRLRAKQLGMSLEDWKHRQPQTRRTITTPTLPNLRKISPVFLAAGVVIIALLGVLLWRPGNGDSSPIVASTATPTTAQVAAATNTSTPTPVPSTTTPGPLFPVTTDEWRSELQQRGTEMTAEGDHYWRYVPAGTYRIGGWTEDGDDDDDAEAMVELGAYWLAKYPVTVQQYAQFIAAGGYDDRDYWTDNGWAWKEAYADGNGRSQPWGWDDERYNSDNQPVIGVTWYEATAFANWMHAHLVDELPQGYRIRLPTEAQWEVGCAYDAEGNRHPYPWGEQDPTRELADFDDGSDPHGAAPVGGRPAGASAAGVQDMVGSVWERMTNSAAGYPAESGAVVADFATDEGDTPYRGGYWGSGDIRISVRCAARFRLNPVYDYHNIGFRLVLSP
jgi:formylglycine-generating enzyme required for sulfatase activity